jgi:hypothetical protein
MLFLEFGEEKQIPRFARDDKKGLFPQPVQPVGFSPCKYEAPQAEACATQTARFCGVRAADLIFRTYFKTLF